jgi:C4-dicarboxylate-specific signal transduction histidine kinase
MGNLLRSQDLRKIPTCDADDDPRLVDVAPGLAHEAMNIAQGLFALAAMSDDTDVNTRTSWLGDRVERLGHHLVQYAQAGTFAPRMVAPRRVIAGARAAVETIAVARDVAVDVRDDACAHRVRGDEVRLTLALSHLVAYLVLRARPGATIAVTTCATDKESGRITFRASAPVTPAYAIALPRFRPFADRIAGESGLELAVAQTIARAHGGVATAERIADQLVMLLAVPAARLEHRWAQRSSS